MRVSFEDFLREQGFHAEAVEYGLRSIRGATDDAPPAEIYRSAVTRYSNDGAPFIGRPEKKHLLP